MHVTTKSLEWQFEKEVICFHCQTKAKQILRIEDNGGTVTCSTCGAQRHYVTRSVIFGTDTPPMPPMPLVGLKYDAWDFEKHNICVHCREHAVHSVYLDEHKMNVVCAECGFSRVFKFDISSTQE
jgi:transcription elongation factor Elf1